MMVLNGRDAVVMVFKRYRRQGNRTVVLNSARRFKSRGKPL
jgi:hypothetical protein